MAAREVENLSGHSALLGMELGGGVRSRAKFVNCDIRICLHYKLSFHGLNVLFSKTSIE